jgi:glutaredoxin
MNTPTPVIYSAPWCAYCTQLKKWFASKNIDYVEKDVDEPGVREEMNQRTDGNQTIPTMFVGDEFWVNPSLQILAEQFIIKK